MNKRRSRNVIHHKPSDNDEKNEGLYKNPLFMNVLACHIGKTAAVKTKTSDIYEGVFRSPSNNFDMVLELAHKVDCDNPDKFNPDTVIQTLALESKDIVSITFTNVDDFTDTDMSFKTDAHISNFNGIVGEKQLEPWSDGLDQSDEMDLGVESNSERGWSVDEMFHKNERQYGVKSTFDETLSSYTCQIERSNTKEYREAEAQATRLAMEIEKNPISNARYAMENGDDEEELFAAVRRNTPDDGGSGGVGKYVPPNRRKSHNNTGGGRKGGGKGYPGDGPYSSNASGNIGSNMRNGNGNPPPPPLLHQTSHRSGNSSRGSSTSSVGYRDSKDGRERVRDMKERDRGNRDHDRDRRDHERDHRDHEWDSRDNERDRRGDYDRERRDYERERQALNDFGRHSQDHRMQRDRKTPPSGRHHDQRGQQRMYNGGGEKLRSNVGSFSRYSEDVRRDGAPQAYHSGGETARQSEERSSPDDARSSYSSNDYVDQNSGHEDATPQQLLQAGSYSKIARTPSPNVNVRSGLQSQQSVTQSLDYQTHPQHYQQVPTHAKSPPSQQPQVASSKLASQNLQMYTQENAPQGELKPSQLPQMSNQVATSHVCQMHNQANLLQGSSPQLPISQMQKNTSQDQRQMQAILPEGPSGRMSQGSMQGQQLHVCQGPTNSQGLSHLQQHGKANLPQDRRQSPPQYSDESMQHMQATQGAAQVTSKPSKAKLPSGPPPLLSNEPILPTHQSSSRSSTSREEKINELKRFGKDFTLPSEKGNVHTTIAVKKSMTTQSQQISSHTQQNVVRIKQEECAYEAQMSARGDNSCVYVSNSATTHMQEAYVMPVQTQYMPEQMISSQPSQAYSSADYSRNMCATHPQHQMPPPPIHHPEGDGRMQSMPVQPMMDTSMMHCPYDERQYDSSNYPGYSEYEDERIYEEGVQGYEDRNDYDSYNRQNEYDMRQYAADMRQYEEGQRQYEEGQRQYEEGQRQYEEARQYNQQYGQMQLEGHEKRSQGQTAQPEEHATKNKDYHDITDALARSNLNPNAKEFVYNPTPKPYVPPPPPRSTGTPNEGGSSQSDRSSQTSQTRLHSLTPSPPQQHVQHPQQVTHQHVAIPQQPPPAIVPTHSHTHPPVYTHMPGTPGFPLVVGPAFVMAGPPQHNVMPGQSTRHIRRVTLGHRTTDFHASNMAVAAATGQPLLAPSVTVPQPGMNATQLTTVQGYASAHHHLAGGPQYQVQMVRMGGTTGVVPLVPTSLGYHHESSMSIGQSQSAAGGASSVSTTMYVNHYGAPTTHHHHHHPHAMPPTSTPSPVHTPHVSLPPNHSSYPPNMCQTMMPPPHMSCPPPPTPHVIQSTSHQQHTVHQYVHHAGGAPVHLPLALMQHSTQ